MRSGNLDKSIRVQSLSTATDSFGQPIETWSDISASPLPAQVLPQRGSERFLAQQVTGQGVVMFKIRYRSDITIKNRIVYNGRNYDIHDVRELGRREGLEIDASAESETGVT